jgi:DNA phosphorothioation-associated putative methyltransferase
MDRAAFVRAVTALSVCKQLPEAAYAHVEALPLWPAELQEAVETALAIAKLDPGTFQVVKLSKRAHRVSLLAYPTFFEEAFPALTKSWAVDLDAGSVSCRSYSSRGNPPILHRKETLLPPGDPRVPDLAALTAAAERAGLFADSKSIGTRAPWERRLARLGLRVEGHRLVETDARRAPALGHDDVPEVQRYRTALHRFSLSAPMQALFRHGFLDGRGSVFDYVRLSTGADLLRQPKPREISRF